ncbi:molybdopterin-dependent oxidoreductase, partial [Shigella sonnei]
TGGTADRNRSHWSTSKTPSYTKSVSWQHHPTRDGVRGKEKLDVPIKFLWCYASNTLINQHGDINHTHEVLQDDSKCEMIVGIDHFMTASAKYCDILLPDLMPTEQEDLI